MIPVRPALASYAAPPREALPRRRATLADQEGDHASEVRDFKGYRMAIYSPNDHFAVLTPPGSNRVIDFKELQPRSTVAEGASTCLHRAETVIDELLHDPTPLPQP